ncbi:MAG: hypothetical protein AB1568_16355 [Thermodesulfobacteriota bacterium]
MPNRWIPTAAFAAFFLLGAAVTGQGADAPSCGQLLVDHCDNCHYISRPCQSLGNKGRWRWKRSLEAMVRYGAKIGRSEMDRLLDCLVDQDPSLLAACRDPLRFKGAAAKNPNHPDPAAK